MYSTNRNGSSRRAMRRVVRLPRSADAIEANSGMVVFRSAADCREPVDLQRPGHIHSWQRLVQQPFERPCGRGADGCTGVPGAGRGEQAATAQQLLPNGDTGLLLVDDQRRESCIETVDALP